MAARADLWGELAGAAVRTPAAILREQAALLGQKTQRLVEAQVETWTSGGWFFHSFNLVVPTLDNYIYELFRVQHGVSLYPVSLPDSEATSEEEFVTWLSQKLSSPETKKIVANLLAQAAG